MTLSEWERCGNTLFFVKTRPHEIVGYTHIDPADFIRVKWEEKPEGFVIVRREVPEDLDWAAAEGVRFSIARLEPRNQSRFWTWTSFLDILKRRGVSSSEIVGNFAKLAPSQINETLDALDMGVFEAPLPWRDRSVVLDSREELDAALSDFGVMECL